MPTRRPILSIAGAAALGAAVVGFLGADHADAPGSTADPAADIADLYAFHDQASDRLTVVLTCAGLQMPASGQAGRYDDEVLYTVNIDTDGDAVADRAVDIRFGQNQQGASGIRVAGLPGGPAVITGPVETTIDSGAGVRVFAGLRDDPFFFDLDGFRATRQTGTISFDSARDTFAGTNLTAIVLETRLSAVASAPFRLWATTARLAAPSATN